MEVVITPSYFNPDDDDWFEKPFSTKEYENPLDSMPIATNNKPEEEKSIHQKMYEIATAKYNPFAIGGSENVQDK